MPGSGVPLEKQQAILAGIKDKAPAGSMEYNKSQMEEIVGKRTRPDRSCWTAE